MLIFYPCENTIFLIKHILFSQNKLGSICEICESIIPCDFQKLIHASLVEQKSNFISSVGWKAINWGSSIEIVWVGLFRKTKARTNRNITAPIPIIHVFLAISIYPILCFV